MQTSFAPRSGPGPSKVIIVKSTRIKRGYTNTTVERFVAPTISSLARRTPAAASRGRARAADL